MVVWTGTGLFLTLIFFGTRLAYRNASTTLIFRDFRGPYKEFLEIRKKMLYE